MIDFSTTGISVSSPYQFPANETSSKTSGNDSLKPDKKDNTDKKNDTLSLKNTSEKKTAEELNLAEIRELSKLKQRDREVKAHEQAHIAAGGAYVRSGASYEYEEGPDGKKYAVGGEVQIDTSKIPGDPEATARKMQILRSAALAPASPSAQDRRVAAKATQIENRMRMEIVAKRYEESASFETGKSEPLPDDFHPDRDIRRTPFPGSIVSVMG